MLPASSREGWEHVFFIEKSSLWRSTIKDIAELSYSNSSYTRTVIMARYSCKIAQYRHNISYLKRKF